MRVARAVRCNQLKPNKRKDTRDKAIRLRTSQAEEALGAMASSLFVREQWQEPRLPFLEPKLIQCHYLEEVTAGFLGGTPESKLRGGGRRGHVPLFS